MREIKFRIWDGESQEYVKDGWSVGSGLFANRDMQSQDPLGEILEQFTGLRDKNGKEVWEGDVVSRNVPLARAGAIQFAQGIFGINWDYGHNPDPLWLEGSMYGSWNGKHNLRPIDDNFMTENMEVIGNIHENPELLK